MRATPPGRSDKPETFRWLGDWNGDSRTKVGILPRPGAGMFAEDYKRGTWCRTQVWIERDSSVPPQANQWWGTKDGDGRYPSRCIL